MINREGIEDLINEIICDDYVTKKAVLEELKRRGRNMCYHTLLIIFYKNKELFQKMKEQKQKRYIELIQEARFHGCESISSVIDYAGKKGEKLYYSKIQKILRKEIRETRRDKKIMAQTNAAQMARILHEYVLRKAKEEDPALYFAWRHYPRRYAKMTFAEFYERIHEIYEGKKEMELAEEWRVTKQAVSNFRIRHGFFGRCKKYKTAG